MVPRRSSALARVANWTVGVLTIVAVIGLATIVTRSGATGPGSVRAFTRAAARGPVTSAPAVVANLAAPPAPALPRTDFVTACGTSFCLADTPIRLAGASVLGGLDDPDGRVALAVAAHLDTVRIVDFLDVDAPDLAAAAVDPSRWARVDRLVAAAHTAGLHVILDLSTYRNLLLRHEVNPYTYEWGPFVERLASRVNTVTGVVYRDDPTIAIISVAGEVEPLVRTSPLTPTTAQLTEFYARTLRELHAADPHHLMSSGGLLQLDWDSGIDWRTIFALPDDDVPAIHVYSTRDEMVTMPAVAALARSLGKPWIVEEFGVTQSVGDARRAIAFGRIFGGAERAGAAGVLFWDLGPEQVGVAGKAETYDVGPATPLTLAEVVAFATRA